VRRSVSKEFKTGRADGPPRSRSSVRVDRSPFQFGGLSITRTEVAVLKREYPGAGMVWTTIVQMGVQKHAFNDILRAELARPRADSLFNG
jgi:hypothetical protein